MSNRQARINIRSVANSKAAKTIRRNGRDLMIVPSATLPDDVVMNGIKYPADEIEKSFHTLERAPAPLGHPMVNGAFVSARDPEGINIGWIGAWNENVRRENGRVFLDKVIDIEVANRTEDGKRLLEAINAGKPIHTSTGLLADLMETGEDEPRYAVCDMFFDHDAILLDEEGAATPAQGVGMMVNGKQIDVINSSLSDAWEEQLDWALDSAARALEQKQRAPMLERLKTVIMEALSMGRETSREQENADMAVDEKKVADLETRLEGQEKAFANLEKTVTDALGGIAASITNAVTAALAPMATSVEALTNAQKATDEARKLVLVNKVVEAGLLSKESADGLTEVALTELANKVKPGKAAQLNAALPVDPSIEDEFKGYDLNAIVNDSAKKEAV